MIDIIASSLVLTITLAVVALGWLSVAPPRNRGRGLAVNLGYGLAGWAAIVGVFLVTDHDVAVAALTVVGLVALGRAIIAVGDRMTATEVTR